MGKFKDYSLGEILYYMVQAIRENVKLYGGDNMFPQVIAILKGFLVQTIIGFQKPPLAQTSGVAGADLGDDVCAMMMGMNNINNQTQQTTPVEKSKADKIKSIIFKIVAVIAAIFLVGAFQMDVILAMEVFALYSMIIMAKQMIWKT